MATDIIGCKDDKVCPLCQSPYMPPKNTILRTTKDILKCVEHFRDKNQEHLIRLSLDREQRLIALRIVTIGTLTSSFFHPREVFAGPLSDRAAEIVVAHNHPSGNPLPSAADILVTQRLVSAGELLGMYIRDHIIFGATNHYSFRQHRMI